MDIERFVGDLADPNRLAVAATGCEAIVHAAGISDPHADRESLGWSHVAGTENAINAAKKADCKRMVHISCADVTLHHGPRSFWNEDEAPTQPFGALAESKLHAEEFVRVSGNRGFRTVVLRPALVWGPGDTTHLRRWMREEANGGIRIVGRGKKLLATTYVDNLAHAVSCALRADLQTGSVYYVVDTELSVCREFFTELCEALGWTPPRNSGPYPWAMALCRAGLLPLHPTEVILRGQTSAFDQSKAQTELGYEPVVTRQQGMVELQRWVAENARGAA